MKKYVISILLLATIGFIALKPATHASPAVSSQSAGAAISTSTTPDGIEVNLAPSVPETASPPAHATAASPAPDVTIEVGSTTYAAYVAPGASALDAMRAAASTTAFTFSGREESGLGFFVESIDGKPNTDGEYWFLYVNGVSSQTGASQTVLQPGDVVEWRYERNY